MGVSPVLVQCGVVELLCHILDKEVGVMREYHKIQTIFKRDPKTNFRTLLIGEYSMPEFEYLADNRWIATEKVDGTNIRVMWNHEEGTLKFGGKTDKAQIPTFLREELHNLFLPTFFVKNFAETSTCLYGEGYGAKIQKGGGNYIPNGVSFVLFDVKVGEWWLKREDVLDIGRNLGIAVVPEIGEMTLRHAWMITRDGMDSFWGNFIAEGLVLRPQVELKTRSGQRIITKIKHKDFPRE